MAKGWMSALKIAGLLVLVVLILFATGLFYLTRGLDAMIELDIGEIDPSALADGVYSGEFDYSRWYNQVEVTIVDQTITAITIVQAQAVHLDEPMDHLINGILQAQNLDVDIRSGATASSKAFLKAVEHALTKDATTE